jgi:outer membrane protein assembly factor BamB
MVDYIEILENKKMKLQKNKTLSAITKNSKRYLIAFSLILLISAIVPTTLNQKTIEAKAQAVSTVPSNMLQYEWLGRQGQLTTYFSAGPAPNSPDVLWQKTYAANVGGYPVAFNGMLFITQSVNITALDPETGNVIYSVAVPPVIPGRTSTVAYVEKVDNTHMLAWATTASVINANQTLPAAWAISGFNIADGSLLWTMPAQTTPASGAYYYVPQTQMIYVQTGNQTGRGSTQDLGAVQGWNLPNPTQPPTLAWTYIVFGAMSGSGMLIYGDGKIFIGGDEAHQVAINATTGKMVWDTLLTGDPTYGASYINGVLYRGLLDNTFVAIDGATGKILWTFNPNDYGFWSSGTAAAYGMVYEVNVDGYIYALNATNGQVVWKYLGPGQSYPGFVYVADGKVYACTGQATFSPLVGMGVSQFSCLNAYNGQVLWQVSKEFLAGPTVSSCIAYGNLYGIDAENASGVTIDSNVPGVFPAATQDVIICYGSTKDWTTFGGTPSHAASGYGGPTNMVLNWKFQTGGAVVSSPAIVQGKVYIGSDDHNWYSLNATTGAKIWNFSVGYYVRSSAAVVNGKMYTGADDGFVYCLDANSGSLLWKTPAPGQVVPIMIGAYPQLASSPTVVNGQVYIGAPDGKLYSLDANTGNVVWTLQTTGGILSTPTYIANDGLYFASVDGFVYKVNPASGTVIWNASTPIGLEIGMEGSACIGNGLVVIGSGSAHNAVANYGQMYALNASTGALVWKYTELVQSGNLLPIWTSLYRNDALGPVFYFNDFFDLDCVNATNGKLIWQSYLTRESFGLPAYADGKIYTGRNTFGVYVSDATLGTKLGYFNAGSEVESSVAIYQNNIYFGCLDGHVFSAGISSAGTTYYGSQTPKPSVASPDNSPAPAPLVISAASNNMYPSSSESPGNQTSPVIYLIVSALAIAIAVAVSATSLLRTRRKK